MEETTTLNPSAMPENSQLRRAALLSLKGNWTYAVLCTLLFTAIFSVVSAVPLASLLVVAPLDFGFSIAFLLFVRGLVTDDDLVIKPFDAFKQYGRMLGASLLVALYTFLWTLLLIVPGIVKSYSYALTPYIVHDNPDMLIGDCLRRSQQMMKGYKWKLFCLDLSFIGWILLSLLTFGIGLLWVTPYIETARVHFYEELKKRQPEAAL